MTSSAMCQEIKYTEGSTYKGGLDAQGLKTGKGELKFADKSTYKGDFVDGLFQGHGILTITTPESGSYKGQFERGKFHGYGVFTKTDNMKYEGQFRDGKMHGLGRMTFKDGTHGVPQYEGKFEDGRFVQSERCSSAVEEAIKNAKKAE